MDLDPLVDPDPGALLVDAAAACALLFVGELGREVIGMISVAEELISNGSLRKQVV